MTMGDSESLQKVLAQTTHEINGKKVDCKPALSHEDYQVPASIMHHRTVHTLYMYCVCTGKEKQNQESVCRWRASGHGGRNP